MKVPLTTAVLLLAAPSMLSAKAEQEIEGIRAEAKGEPSPLKGEWPSPAPKISLDLRGATVGEALQQLADAADWGLAMSGAEAHAETGSLTVAVENRPATELLDIILETSGLEAKLKAGVLMVSPTGPPPGAVEAEIGDLHVKVKPGHGIRIHGGHGDKDNRVLTGDVRVEKDEVVDDAVALGGSVEVAGHVRGDAVAMGGSIILESGARVDGDAVAMGGEVTVPDDAVVHGDRVALGGGSIGGLIGALVGAASDAKGIPVFAFGILAALLRAVTLIILALLIMAFLPERVERVRDFMVANIGQSVLGGLALLLGFVPLIVLLAITLVGIALIPVVVVVFASFLVVGLTALATWLGHRIPLFEERKTPMVAMLLGLAVILLVDFIPFVGAPIIFAASLVGAGAVMLSRFGRAQPNQPAEPPASTEEPAL